VGTLDVGENIRTSIRRLDKTAAERWEDFVVPI
jgi:hypothetical protein